jgi:hypothetical protein
MWKEAVMVYVEILFWHLPGGGTYGSLKKPQSEEPVFGPI